MLIVPVVQCIIAGEAFCRPRSNRVKMADNSDEVVPASLQCGICSQLCKRGVKVHLVVDDVNSSVSVHFFYEKS